MANPIKTEIKKRNLKWREVRAIVLDRDNRRCTECGEHCANGDADVHHLVPRASGGMDEPANLITLCDGCHAARHPNLQGTLARRSIELWGLRLAKWLDRQGDLTNLDESLGITLRMLGVDRLRTAQLEVVLAAMRGESVLFVSATGSGKSLCFQLPTLLSRGCAYVISPLKALMSQQVSSLVKQKIPATFINGDLGPQDKEIRYGWLKDDAIKFLYCTPERFDSAMVRHTEVEQITRARPSYLVIDEAHCIDRWGNDFRPNYVRLGAVRDVLGRPPILAFTATAGRASQQRILQSLGTPDARVIVTGVDRPNIALARLEVESDYKRFGLLADLLRRMPPGRAMLFVPTVKIGNEVQKGLRSMGLDVPFFHSGFGTANERDTLLGRFTGRIEPALDIVICTSAFGMGLDVSNVRLVVHWQHPASMEDYLQEFGRAGRDGAPSVAILFTRDNDADLLNWMAERTVEQSGLDDADKSGAFQFRNAGITRMQEHATRRDACFRDAIVQYFGDTQSIRRKSLAIRVLEWLFSRSHWVKHAPGCCDRCDEVGVDNVVDWAARIWGETGVLPRRSGRASIESSPVRRVRPRS
ncbi:MAG: RecQ family ATP-dependent DNA helicase [Phycisphaerae bacterium]|nr:RecQ family ATP-dependent DNA helicase [Gemmatimonadaceae bacterium]